MQPLLRFCLNEYFGSRPRAYLDLSHMQHEMQFESPFSSSQAIMEAFKPPQTGPLSLMTHSIISHRSTSPLQ